MAFRVGQKVVCVDNSSTNNTPAGPDKYLKISAIYTVRRVAAKCPYWRHGPVVWLEEVCREDARFYGQPAPDMPFFAARFRPVVERKTETGMAILREILERESHQDRVPVKTP